MTHTSIAPLAVLAALLSATACTGGDKETETGETGETGTDVYHPLIPVEYWYLWDIDGCETQSGNPGSSVYKVATGTSTETTITITEDWYWLFGRADFSGDCIDTFTITGTYEQRDYGQFECSGCDEGWDVTWELTASNCGVTYYSLFDLEERVEEEVYEGYLLFDTLTPSGNPNYEDAMLVYPYWLDPSTGYLSRDLNYAEGTAVPIRSGGEEEPYGPPSDYTWTGSACVGSGR